MSGADVTDAHTDDSLPASSQGLGSSSNLAGAQVNGDQESQVARFGAAKEKKHSLESGITAFNRFVGGTCWVVCPVKMDCCVE